MGMPDVIKDATLLSVRELSAITGIPPSTWTMAVADQKLGAPFLKSGAWQVRAVDAVRFLKSLHHTIPRELEGIDRTTLVYCTEEADQVLALLGRFSKVVDAHACNSVLEALWLAGRHLPQVVVLPLTGLGCLIAAKILDRDAATTAVMIGEAPPDSVAAQAKSPLMGRNVLFLAEPDLGAIARLLKLPDEYLTALEAT